jgi:hypothetical protein
MLRTEDGWRVMADDPYARFAQAVTSLKADLLGLLQTLKARGKRIAAYGASAKGVTLTSYCGIDDRLVDYVVDRSPYKKGQFFPVGRLPIFAPERLTADMPDYALMLTWNFADEIVRQQQGYLDKGGTFIVPVPAPRLVEHVQRHAA